MKMIRVFVCCFVAAMMCEIVLAFPPQQRPQQCNCPNIPAPPPSPPPCGRDEDCPQYFAPSCGYFHGQIMTFSGPCHMENYNCRTGLNFREIPLTYCQARSNYDRKPK